MKVKKKQAKELKEWAGAIAEASGRKTKDVLDELTAELKQIVQEPYLQAMDDDAKVENAIRILKAKHTAPLTQSGRDFEVLVLDYTKGKRVTPKDKAKEPYDRADIYGLGFCTEEDAKSDEQEVKFISIALFDDNIELVKQVEREVTYNVNLSGKVVAGFWQLSGIEGMTNFAKAKEQADIDVEAVLTDLFPLVPIAEAEFNISAPRKNDLKLVRGNVHREGVHTSDSGFTYGRYSLIDDSLDVEDIKKNGGLSVMVDKSQVIWNVGSDVYILGELEKDDQYGMGMVGMMIHAVIPIPKETTDDIDEIEDELDEDYDDDDELSLDGDEGEEEQPDEAEPEEEDEPEEKPKKPTKKPSKKASEKDDEEDDDDDDEGGTIELGDD